MHIVRPLTVGPILGSVTENDARIFGRGDSALGSGILKITLGRIRYRRKGRGRYSTREFRFNRTFDFTGAITLLELQPAADYEYQVGFVDDPEAQALELDWSYVPVYSFRTAPNDTESSTTVLLGSCCYRGFDEDQRADKTFRRMNEIVKEHGADATILMGDQIYADSLGDGLACIKDTTRPRTIQDTYRVMALIARALEYSTCPNDGIEANLTISVHGNPDKTTVIAAGNAVPRAPFA